MGVHVCFKVGVQASVHVYKISHVVIQESVSPVLSVKSLSPFSEIYIPKAGSYSPPFSGWPSTLNDSGVVIFTSLNF